MATLYSNKVIKSHAANPPGMVSTVTYTVSRSGNKLTYKMTISMRTDGDSLSWWNDTWVCRIWANGSKKVDNLVVKDVTSGTIGTKWFSKTVKFSVSTSASSGTIPISINYYTAGYSGSISKQGKYQGNGSGKANIVPLPVVSISLRSKKNNSITLNWAAKNTNATKVKIYNGNTYLGVFTSNPITLTGLKPNTLYRALKGFGYNHGAYGTNGNTISVRTYPNPVSVKGVSVSDITPFGVTVKVTSSNTTYTNLIEYTILDSKNNVIKSPVTSTSYTYTFSGLQPDTKYKARVRVRTSSSNVWSAYQYVEFSTISDQSEMWAFDGTTWRKGKLFVKDNDIWLPAKKLFVNDNGNWRESTNK